MKKEIYIEGLTEEERVAIGESICQQLQGNPDFASCLIGCDYTSELGDICIWVDDNATTSPKIEIQL